MWVGQRGGKEELEVVIVRNGTLTDLNGPVLTLLDLLLEKDGLKGGINVLTDILQENPLTELNSQLKGSNQVVLR